MNDAFADGEYSGSVSREFIARALDAYKTYKADKEQLISRIRDNELFYRASYIQSGYRLNSELVCDTPFIFSAIENARAAAIDSYPAPNILEREPDGSRTAELLSKIVPAQLDISEFKRVYKENMRSKLKFGTAVYGVFYNELTGNIDIRAVDILDIYVDMHLSDIQDSQFLFISAAVENDLLRERYPEHAHLFSGNAEVETLCQSYTLKNRSSVLDCYYKKTDGTLHMIKFCHNTVISATEDMDGYENGIYAHRQYPVVFDVLYPVEHCPFGFGMIDIGKPSQVEINKLDRAVTENIMCGAKPRYLAKRSGGVDEEEFKDVSRNIVHYEGEPDALRPIDNTSLNEYYLTHREYKKDELKEILANRDFQQGATNSGVTAASAIETLRQSGEKRSRAIINDTYDSYKKIVIMMLELMRQFFDDERTYRVTDELGRKSFAGFDKSRMFKKVWGDDGLEWRSLYFDVDIVPQHESPYSRETANNTIMSFWQNGLFEPASSEAAVTALKNMSFDGKEQLIDDIQRLSQRSGGLVAVDISGGDKNSG